jgi:hypothetical protein
MDDDARGMEQALPKQKSLAQEQRSGGREEMIKRLAATLLAVVRKVRAKLCRISPERDSVEATAIEPKRYKFWYSPKQSRALAAIYQFELSGLYRRTYIHGKLYTECSNTSKTPRGAWEDYVYVDEGTINEVTFRGPWCGGNDEGG